MKFILALVLTTAFAYFCRKSIKKSAHYYYVGALVISAFTVFADMIAVPVSLDAIMSTLFQYGTVATAMLTLVMYANAFPNGTAVPKTLMPIRAELSIIACILTYGHNIFTGKTYFIMLLTKREKVAPLTLGATLMTIVLLLMMTPLFITSFPSVRKRMKPKAWKKLQRMAYPFYMLIYVHIMCLMLPLALRGIPTYFIDVAVYSVVFLGYATLRLLKYYKKSKKNIAIVAILGMYAVLGGVLAVNLMPVVPEPTITDDPVILEDNAQEDIPDTPYDIDLSAIADGDYTGSAMGFNGDVTVTVTMEGGAIAKITLDDHVDDEEYMGNATRIRKKIIEAQDIGVDAISGATFSSTGIKDAVLQALTQ